MKSVFADTSYYIALLSEEDYVPLVRQLLIDPGTVFIPASAALFDAGLKLFAARYDHTWSLVDCISFVVMKQRRLKEALTADRHFVQAGFRALLREQGQA